MPKSFSFDTPRLGVACTSYLYEFTPQQMASFDYVEVPVELLMHDDLVLEKLGDTPVVLHCASLSLAGYTAPAKDTVDEIARYINLTGSPWLGEHLSFILADKLDDALYDQYAPGEPYNIGYTVSPVMNAASVEHVIGNVNTYINKLGLPIILENPPLYFTAPGSDMSQLEFIDQICARSDIGLLLDLAHFFITARNFGYDPKKALEAFPLERVKEIHISGVCEESGSHWDNHADTAPPILFEMLGLVLDRVRPQAITMEYNWSAKFPADILARELDRTRKVLSKYSVL